jgi:hypothetical protein
MENKIKLANKYGVAILKNEELDNYVGWTMITTFFGELLSEGSSNRIWVNLDDASSSVRLNSKDCQKYGKIIKDAYLNWGKSISRYLREYIPEIDENRREYDSK